jgi:energy-coupling factor transporter transmembrane protein EcfT
LSPWGHLCFTGWALLVSVLAKGWWLVGLGLVEVLFGLMCGRDGLRLLTRRRFWIFVLGAVALAAFVLGEPDAALGPLRISRAGAAQGLEMASRAFVISLGFSVGLANLSLFDIIAVFDRFGLRGLGFAAAVAMNLLQTLEGMVMVTLHAIRLRGGLRRPRRALRLFLVTVVANTLSYGDDVVKAAAVRAFDPNGGQRARLPLRAADLGLIAALAAFTGVLLKFGGTG